MEDVKFLIIPAIDNMICWSKLLVAEAALDLIDEDTLLTPGTTIVYRARLAIKTTVRHGMEALK